MNSLVILFHSLSASSLSCYGADFRTPTFDELAARGDIFTNCYSDAAGKLIDELVRQLPTQVVSETNPEIDFSKAANIDTQNNKTLIIVVEVISDREAKSYDQILSMILAQAKSQFDSSYNLVVTALKGAGSKKDEVALPNDLNAHVPLIVSVAGQTTSRRRMELLTSSNVVELIELLRAPATAYQEYRDSLTNNQITYSSGVTTATRTQHWLHLQSNETDDHGETSQQLFRKPEDVWEILDVADQYPQVIDHFAITGQLSFPDSV